MRGWKKRWHDGKVVSFAAAFFGDALERRGGEKSECCIFVKVCGEIESVAIAEQVVAGRSPEFSVVCLSDWFPRFVFFFFFDLPNVSRKQSRTKQPRASFRDSKSKSKRMSV